MSTILEEVSAKPKVVVLGLLILILILRVTIIVIMSRDFILQNMSQVVTLCGTQMWSTSLEWVQNLVWCCYKTFNEQNLRVF